MFSNILRICLFVWFGVGIYGKAYRLYQTSKENKVYCVQEKRSLPSDREPAVKRGFKCFVEERDDKYTMELLLLPSALKEELLGLAHSPTSTNASFLVGVYLHTFQCDLIYFYNNY